MTNETNTKPVAKSLHTITVLMQIARTMMRLAGINDPERAMTAAMIELGLDGRPDPYGLREKALRLMAATPATA